MSEKMYPIPFKSLMNWIVTEYACEGEIFGVHTPYYATGKTLPIFGETIETPFGPAAGPNSQLAQNIIAAYFTGARFFEVKTVQKMDGEELARCVPRPCILAADEGYNQEWSTELEVPQAQNEYIKAWCALKIMSKVYGFGDPDGFVFNMSVGYDLEGIKGRKVNSYIDNMMDASRTAQFKECKKVLTELFPAERAPRDWSGYANVITVTAGEDGPVVTAGLQKRVTFRPKGEDETVAAAELIAKAFCPPEAPMPTDALKARIDAFLEAHNTLALATGCGKWVRCTPLEYLRVDGRLYILTEGGLKFKGIWWNGAISAAVFDSYAGMASLAGLQMTGTAVYIDPLSDEYRSVIEARGVQLQQLQQMPAMLHAVRLDITRYELLDGALRADGYAARQVLDLG